MKNETPDMPPGVAAQSGAFERGDATALEFFDSYVARIEKFNPRFNAFLDLRLDDARAAAIAATNRWRKGTPLSPIDGVAFGVKANIAVRGLPWHGGIGAYRDRIARTNADCVARLVAKGAIPLGTLNMHEGALGATTDNPHYGRCHNPWNEELTPGGSSGGSGAAVAAGLCAFALGTDTMGSVRIPSAYCGVAGLKPSFGAIASAGLLDLSPTLDHIGPHALNSTDIGLVFEALVGGGAAIDPATLRIGIANWGAAIDVDPEIIAAFESAQSLLSGFRTATEVDISGFHFGKLRRRGLLVSEAEGFNVHVEALRLRADGFSPTFRNLLEWGARQPEDKLAAAYSEIEAAGAKFNEIFNTVDLLIMPTAPQGPFAFGADVPANQADLTCIANFAGAPSIAVPACLEGAPPPSLQFAARKGNDRMVLAAAAAFEARRGPAPLPGIV